MQSDHGLDIPTDVFALVDRECAQYIANSAFLLINTVDLDADVEGDEEFALLHSVFDEIREKLNRHLPYPDAVLCAGALIIRIHQTAQRFSGMVGGVA